MKAQFKRDRELLWKQMRGLQEKVIRLTLLPFADETSVVIWQSSGIGAGLYVGAFVPRTGGTCYVTKLPTLKSSNAWDMSGSSFHPRALPLVAFPNRGASLLTASCSTAKSISLRPTISSGIRLSSELPLAQTFLSGPAFVYYLVLLFEKIWAVLKKIAMSELY